MQMTDRQKKIWGIATVIGLVVFMGLLCWFVGRPMIRFVSEPEKFRLWVDEHGIWGRLAFIGMVIFQIIVAIIPGEPLEIGAGYAFGAVEGTILCLIGAVLVGVNFAKGAALALDRPLIPVHHVRGHIAANYLTHPDLEPPFVCLCVSGGTTAIVDVRSYTEMEVLGGTRDDAAGECFDKVARVLGIGYPGGAPMDRLADGGDDAKYELPRAHVQGAELDMSFSGLKTACLNLIHNAQQKGDALDLPSFAASFGRAVSESLVPRAMEASRRKGYGRLAVAGGVAANRRIRADLEAACRQSGDRLFLPELKYCGDNAAMIGCQGYYEFLAGRTAGLDLNAYATRDISLG